jgi:nucleotide-binding universal stress UspA family protein
MTNLTSLLLAVDASAYAEAAARYAGFFSVQLGLPLEALHVLDSRVAGAPATLDTGVGDMALLTPEFDADVQEVLQGRGDEIKGDTDALLRQLGVGAELELAAGLPVAEIMDRAAAETLLVLGKEGEAASLSCAPRLGGVAERVVRRAEGAVLLVPSAFAQPRRLLLGYDGSAGAEGALEYVVALARLLKLPVRALNAHRDEAAAQRQLDTVRARAERENVRLETEYRYGDPAEAILSATQEGDIIAIGAFGAGRLAEFFRGSTTGDIVRKANVPVLLHH